MQHLLILLHLKVSTVGVLAGVAPMIGTIAACLISGPLTDWSARWLSVRNHGMCLLIHPPMRIVLLGVGTRFIRRSLNRSTFGDFALL